MLFFLILPKNCDADSKGLHRFLTYECYGEGGLVFCAVLNFMFMISSLLYLICISMQFEPTQSKAKGFLILYVSYYVIILCNTMFMGLDEGYGILVLAFIFSLETCCMCKIGFSNIGLEISKNVKKEKEQDKEVDSDVIELGQSRMP